MRLNLVIAGLMPVLLSACTPMLSTRTDDQAWLDYLSEQKAKRMPASNSLLEKFPESSIRKILLSCHDSEQVESCYRAKALVSFDSVFKNEPGYKQLQKDFLGLYSFDKVFAEVQGFHQTLLSGMDLRASDHVRELHQRCENRDELGVNIAAFRPYLGGDTDVPKAYYSCLNEEFEKDEEQLLTETSERLGLKIATPEAWRWIRDRQIRPVYEKYTHDLFQKQEAAEKEKWNSERAELLGRFEAGENLQTAVKRLSTELRAHYRFLPIEIYLTELYAEFKKGTKHP